jgi:nicotinamidase-related amidase
MLNVEFRIQHSPFSISRHPVTLSSRHPVTYAGGMSQPYMRSPELMSAADSALLIVDVQEKLMPLIPGQHVIIWNIRRLLDGAGILGVPVHATEQYPRGLGPTVPELAARLASPLAKTAFSSVACPEIVSALDAAGRHKVLVAGIEAHVCIQQTVLDLLAGGFRVYVAVDAVGARHDVDYQTALRRMDSCGATLTTTEAALFEWCQQSGTPEFKQISALVRESPPAQ